MPTTAAVLVGGLGTRLRAAVIDHPKVLAPAAGRHFLDFVLAYLASQGVKRVILCVGYLAEQVRAFAGDGRAWGLEISYSEERIPLGTGGALRQASQGLSGPFFALNGDTLFLADLNTLWQAHRLARALATVALLPMADGLARGCVTLGEDGRIIAFDEKPPEAQAVLVNAGLYVLEPQAFASLPPGQSASIERDIFPHLAALGQLGGCVQEAYFADIGTPESLAAFERDVQKGIWHLETVRARNM